MSDGGGASVAGGPVAGGPVAGGPVAGGPVAGGPVAAGRGGGGGRVRAVSLFRRHYGAGPLHLLALLACFAFSAYVVNIMYHAGHGQRVLVWFVGAILGHDLILFPLYAVADRSAGLLAARRHPDRLPVVPWINYLRVPVVISAMLLGISFPLVLGLSNRTYHAASGLTVAPYENRYLLVVALLFGSSAVLYALRLGRAVTAGPPRARTDRAPSVPAATTPPVTETAPAAGPASTAATAPAAPAATDDPTTGE